MIEHETASATAQLKRILLALPALADDRAHTLAELANRAGTDEDTLVRDLRMLVTRNGDEPAGFVEPVRLALGADSVQLDAPGFFRRPMGLTSTELHAIELGLATLRQEAPLEEHRAIDGARSRLSEAVSRLEEEEGTHAVGFDTNDATRRAVMATVQRCVANRCVAEIEYQGADDVAAATRRVRPFGLVHSRGRWYLVAWCLVNDALRVFRLDRIVEAVRTEEVFEFPVSFQLDGVLREGRVLSSEGEKGDVLRVRFSARIARWIEEREEIVLRNENGSVEVEYPLLSLEWGVGFVLQYGEEAECVGPDRARSDVDTVLRAIVRAQLRVNPSVRL